MPAQQIKDQRKRAEDQGDIRIVDPLLRQGFAQLPRLVLRARGLSDKAKIVYALLLDYAWQQGSCFPGQQRLARDLSTTERTIRRALDELKCFKLIDWKRRGLSQTNVYYILSPQESDCLVSEADRTDLSDQERTTSSGLERTPVSDKEDPGEREEELNLRNSNGDAFKESTQLPAATDAPRPGSGSVSQPIRLSRTAARHGNHAPGFARLGDALRVARADLLGPTTRSSESHGSRGQTISPPLAVCIRDIAQEFGDGRHLRSNLSQAQRLSERSLLHEAAYISLLYEARAVTIDRRREMVKSGQAVSRPMAYFWAVVRDQLGIHADSGEDNTAFGVAEHPRSPATESKRLDSRPSR